MSHVRTKLAYPCSCKDHFNSLVKVVIELLQCYVINDLCNCFMTIYISQLQSGGYLPTA